MAKLTLGQAGANGAMKTLLSLNRAGTNMSTADYDGRTALHLAAANGKVRPLHDPSCHSCDARIFGSVRVCYLSFVCSRVLIELM